MQIKVLTHAHGSMVQCAWVNGSMRIGQRLHLDVRSTPSACIGQGRGSLGAFIRVMIQETIIQPLSKVNRYDKEHLIERIRA